MQDRQKKVVKSKRPGSQRPLIQAGAVAFVRAHWASGCLTRPKFDAVILKDLEARVSLLVIHSSLMNTIVILVVVIVVIIVGLTLPAPRCLGDAVQTALLCRRCRLAPIASCGAMRDRAPSTGTGFRRVSTPGSWAILVGYGDEVAHAKGRHRPPTRSGLVGLPFGSLPTRKGAGPATGAYVARVGALAYFLRHFSREDFVGAQEEVAEGHHGGAAAVPGVLLSRIFFSQIFQVF
mmetsp:Transcript_23319/g.49704  ORF Transcript_23319/g.49704 Transcript_23319/m.49704 type:complete len:235 (-) Transcript_23319:372-1076(-)